MFYKLPQKRLNELTDKKLSNRRETARRAMLINSCCFTSYVSYKGFKHQK